jgi:hypothetical protein
VQFNGAAIPFVENPSPLSPSSYWTYDPTSLTLTLAISSPTSTSQTSTAKFTFENSLSDPLLGIGFERKLARLQECKDLLDDDWGTYLFCPLFFPFSLSSLSSLSSLEKYLIARRYYPSNYPTLLIAAGIGLDSNVRFSFFLSFFFFFLFFLKIYKTCTTYFCNILYQKLIISQVSTIYDNVLNFNALVQIAIDELNALSATPDKTTCLGFLQTA